MNDIVKTLQQTFHLQDVPDTHPIRRACDEIVRLRAQIESATALLDQYAKTNESSSQRVMTLAAECDRLREEAERMRLLAVEAQRRCESVQQGAKRALSELINLQPHLANGLLTKQQLGFIDPHIDLAIEALQDGLGVKEWTR